MNRKFLALIVGVIAIVGILFVFRSSRTPPSLTPAEAKPTTIRYGISPFQDTAMPVVAEAMGLYKKNTLSVELLTVPWEDIVPSLASAGRTIDIGIGSINLLLPRAENINVKGGGDVIFYYPLYVFKGASLMMRKNSGMRSLSDFLKMYPKDRDRAVREATEQLRGKKIALPQGTPYEQMLLAALKSAEMDPKKDVDLRYVKLADALPAFLAGDLDVIGAGVTQRTEAMRHGHQVFLDMETFGFAEVIGIVTTAHFANQHRKELDRLVQIWFESVDRLMSDVDTHSKAVLDYLAKNSSTKYSLQEYKDALSFQEFPRNPEAARALMMDPSGKFFWKRTWDVVNQYLVATKKVESPIPYDYCWAGRIVKEMQN